MSKDIKSLLKEATKDLLTEETLTTIQESFDTAVNERAKIRAEKALLEQDSDYADKLEKLVVAIDKDHTHKLNRIVEAIDINHADKLKKVVTGYEKQLNLEASKFKTELVNTISKYLELYLEEKVPAETIKEAVDNKRANLVLDEIKNILSIDQAMAQSSIREAVVDGKKTIDELTNRVAELTAKSRKLEEAYSATKSSLLIERSIAELDEPKKDYMKRMLANKSAKYISENFQYILGLYDKNERETLDVLKEQATKHSVSNDIKVPEPVIEEEVSAGDDSSGSVNAYLTELVKF